jgi:sterol desaturase/sphingolipid hydroxylase (fatty acid hydroxylase superfamily)
MHLMAEGLFVKLPLFLITALLTHLIVSFFQTALHIALAHRPLGGKLFRNHVGFHHRYYSKDHLVSKSYLAEEGNLTPLFLIPVFIIGILSYLVLPLDLFIVQAIVCALSFYAHVHFDKEYHVEGSYLERFSWFRKMQALHFVHHHHADRNFAVIDFYWDKLLGTYRKPDLL